MNYLPGLASNHDPPDLCLFSTKDYRLSHQCPANKYYLLLMYPFLFLFGSTRVCTQGLTLTRQALLWFEALC
jgi:hypothetical protein